jgi:hypothetical protein
VPSPRPGQIRMQLHAVSECLGRRTARSAAPSSADDAGASTRMVAAGAVIGGDSEPATSMVPADADDGDMVGRRDHCATARIDATARSHPPPPPMERAKQRAVRTDDVSPPVETTRTVRRRVCHVSCHPRVPRLMGPCGGDVDGMRSWVPWRAAGARHPSEDGVPARTRGNHRGGGTPSPSRRRCPAADASTGRRRRRRDRGPCADSEQDERSCRGPATWPGSVPGRAWRCRWRCRPFQPAAGAGPRGCSRNTGMMRPARRRYPA